MTDKEQIIIDGVDVSECAYFDYENEGTKECYAYSNECEANNCYFKQLARKTQECESLKQEIEILQNNFDTATRDRNDEIEILKQECEELKEEYTELKLENKELYRILADLKEVRKLKDRYRKALEKIEQELKEDIYCESQECGCDDFEECLRCTKDQILNIINKAKDGNNE